MENLQPAGLSHPGHQRAQERGRGADRCGRQRHDCHPVNGALLPGLRSPDNRRFGRLPVHARAEEEAGDVGQDDWLRTRVLGDFGVGALRIAAMQYERRGICGSFRRAAFRVLLRESMGFLS